MAGNWCCLGLRFLCVEGSRSRSPPGICERSCQHDAGVDASGLNAETARGEKAIRAGVGVDSTHENGIKRHTALFKFVYSGRPKVDVRALEETTSHDAWWKLGLQKSIDDFFAHFEGIRTDAGADYCTEVTRIRPQGAHTFDGVGKDVPHHAAPTGVSGTNHTVLRIVEQHRYAIGGGNADAYARQRSDQGIDIVQVAIALATFHFHQCFVDKDYPVGVSLMRQQELVVVDVQC